MDSQSLALVAGTILTLAFSYVPKLNTKFAALDSEVKRLIMAGLLFAVSLAVFGIACLGYGSQIGVDVVCDTGGAIEFGKILVIAIIANQSIYTVSPKTAAVQETLK
jgi:hypothetical protein